MNADQLRQAMAALPEPVTTLKPPHWEYWRWELWQKAQQDDPIFFMSWPCVYHTMLTNHWSMDTEWDYLTRFDRMRWPGEWTSKLMAHTGKPPDYFRGTPYSNNMINQAYHIALWENTTGKRIDQLDTIIEFGGGYGAMALLCQRLGFKGSYWIEDLPELSALQEYYLSSTADTSRVYYCLPYHYECDLFIASHSLSEIEPEERRRVLRGLRAGSFLFVFHCEHNGVDNLEWFRQLAKSRPEYEWSSWYTEHLPNQWYQIGVRK